MQQAITIYISQEGGEVSDLQDLVDGTEVELDWVGTLNGQDVPVKVRLSDVPAEEDDFEYRPTGHRGCGDCGAPPNSYHAGNCEVGR